MKIIQRTFTDTGAQVLSEPIPQNSLRNVWVGDQCTVYEDGDVLPADTLDAGVEMVLDGPEY